MTASNVFTWVRPQVLHRTQCTARGNDCRYNSVLDFVFIANMPASWEASSEIIVRSGDFPDNRSTSDHRQVAATFSLSDTEPDLRELKDELIQRILAMESELDSLKTALNKLFLIVSGQ